MKIEIQNVRLKFPNLFKKDKWGRYSADLLFPTDGAAHKELIKVADAVGKEEFASKWPTVRAQLIKQDKFVVHGGEVRAIERPEYEGQSYIKAKNTVHPKLRDRAINTIEDEGVLYGGCRVDAYLFIKGGTHTEGGPYLSVQLLGVQFRADDEAFTGGATIDDEEFKTIADEDL